MSEIPSASSTRGRTVAASARRRAAPKIPFMGRALAAGAASLWLGGFAMAAEAEVKVDPAAAACRATGLLALQQTSPDITDLIIDMDSLAISAADTKVEDVSIKKVLLGESYIKRGEKVATEKTGAPDRFVCLIGEKGKVLLTFFTAK
jgi:hypothetical protein